MAASLLLPSELLRSSATYRTIGASVHDGMVGIGVIDKSGRVDDASDILCEHYSALYVLRGSGTYSDATGIRERFSQGSLIQRLTDRRHTVRFDPGCGFVECFIALNKPLSVAFQAMSLIDSRRPVVHPGLDLAMAQDLVATRERLRRASELELARLGAHVIDLLLDLLTRDRRAAPDDPHGMMVEHACEALASSLDERPMLAQIIKRSQISYERFRKIFRSRMNVSPGEYRIRRRIERARELLANPELSVRAISEILGYPNPYSFSTQFKHAVGLSPLGFRRRRG
jgi:AraC family transcriptional regulator of arabinose operon